MSSLTEIEAAIDGLSAADLEALENRLLSRRFGLSAQTPEEFAALLVSLDEAEKGNRERFRSFRGCIAPRRAHMGWQVTFSLRSRSDLQKITEFIARDDPAAAERFGLALITQAESLANAPHIGMPMAARPGTRLIPFGVYLIIYRADEPTQTVRILRFWHGARRRRPTR